MGLMDFVKDVGRQIFDTDAEAANNIRQHLEFKTKGIDDLGVEFSDGVATLTGECTDQETKDIAILIAGCIKGVKQVDADGLIAPMPKRRRKRSEFYTIKMGDTLSAIAERYYGDASDSSRIFEANREIIVDPEKLYPGQTIRIPID